MQKITASKSGQSERLGNGNFVSGNLVRGGESFAGHHSAQGDWRTRANAKPLQVTRTHG